MPELPDNLENMTDQELLHEAVVATEEEIRDAAWAKEPPGEEPEGTPEAEPVKEGAEPSPPPQPRNQRGQFAPRDAASESEAEQAEEQEGEQAEQREGDDGEAVPRWRMREIAEERRQEKARTDALHAENLRMRAQLAQIQQAQPQSGQQEIDPLLDPQGFATRLRNDMAQQIAHIRLDSNLQVAHLRHGETFEKAYEALVQEGHNGNGALIDRLCKTGNPGESIVRWFKERELMTTTGGDLNKYKEQLLKDPEFLKAAIDAVRNAGGIPQPSQQQQGSRPSNITRLPPSLSRASGGSPNSDPIDTDDSDRAVFEHAFR